MALVERKPSISIWRRFVKRDSRDAGDVTSTAVNTTLVRSVSQKLQRRPTTLQKRERRDQPIQSSPSWTASSTASSPLASPSQPVIPTHSRVLASDMHTTPFPASPSIHTVPWKVFLPPTHVYRLVMGHLPTSTSDKWFIYSEGPDTSGKLKVHFHRSWTGMKIATVFVVVDWKGEGAGTIVGIKWNGSSQTEGMGEREAKYMVGMCCGWVLGVDLEGLGEGDRF